MNAHENNRGTRMRNTIMQRHISKLAVIAPLALLFWTLSVQASTQVGQAVVKVADPDGNPVAEATVELSGAYLIGGARTATTDKNGTARFTQLTPGPDYQVVVNHANYRPTKTTGIVVKLGATVTIPVELLPPEEDLELEEIVVTGDVPMVDTEKLKLGLDITADFAEQLPTSRNYQGMVVFVPGIQDADSNGNPNVMGGVEEANQYLLDGVNVTDPVTNTFNVNFNFDAIQSVEIITGGRDAEYGSAQGGVINIVTKGGSNEFQFDGSVYWEPDFFQLKRPGEDERFNQSVDLNLAAGGPIVKDELWYYVSLMAPMNWTTASQPEGGSIFPDQEDEERPTRNYLGFYPLGKLTWAATEDTTFKLVAQADPAIIHNARQISTVHPDAERTQIQTGFLTALFAETFLTEDLFWDNRVNFSRGGIESRPECRDGHPDEANDCTSIPGRTNQQTGASTVNYTQISEDTRTRLQMASALTYTVDDWFGEHQFKGGVDVHLTWFSQYFSRPGGAYFIDDGVDPSDPMSISGAGVPYRKVEVFEAQDTTIFGDTESVYLQDVWKPLENLTIRPGVRFDSARMRNWEDEIQININTFSPRFGVAWDPFDDGKTQVKAGYYMYADTGFLSLSDFAGGRDAVERTFLYNPVTEEYDIFLGESGGAGAVEAKKYLQDPWNQRRPRTHEVIAGVTRELVTDLNLSVDYTFRYAQNQWEDDEVNVIWNDTGDDAIGFEDGEPQNYIYSLGAMRDSWLRFHSVQVQLNKRFSRNWQMLASYTWSKSEGTQGDYIISVAFDLPRERDYEYGYSPWDVRHDLKVSGSYQFPYGIVVGGRFRYVTGQPYNRIFLNNFYGDYYSRRAPRGYDICPDDEPNCDLDDRARLRLPDYMVLNARVMWQLEELTGQKIDLIVDAFNVLNLDTPIEVEQRNLPDSSDQRFGDVTSTRNPASFQVGVRYRY